MTHVYFPAPVFTGGTIDPQFVVSLEAETGMNFFEYRFAHRDLYGTSNAHWSLVDIDWPAGTVRVSCLSIYRCIYVHFDTLSLFLSPNGSPLSLPFTSFDTKAVLILLSIQLTRVAYEARDHMSVCSQRTCKPPMSSGIIGYQKYNA